MSTKKCSKCGEVKELSQFSKRTLKSGKISYQPKCKDCNRAYREEHDVAIKIGKARHYMQNKAEIRKTCNEKYQCNKDIINETLRHRYNTDSEYRERVKAWNKKSAIKNKDLTTEYKRIWSYNRRHTNVNYKLKGNLSKRILYAVKAQHTVKSKRSQELLGCSMSKIRNYIESLFKEGMSWDNYGRFGWHVDHIRPCSSFDLTDPEQQKKCFHYTNLQPLWAEENLKKGDKWSETSEER